MASLGDIWLKDLKTLKITWSKKNFIWKESVPSTASKWFYVPFLLDQYLTSFWVILKWIPASIDAGIPFFGHKTFCLWPNICHRTIFSMLFDSEPGWCIADEKSAWNHYFSKSYSNFFGIPASSSIENVIKISKNWRRDPLFKWIRRRGTSQELDISQILLQRDP